MQPILTVDLSTGHIGQFLVPEDWERDYIGGASLAARLLYEYMTADLEPLSPEAPLLFLNGPLSGTSGPAVGRFIVAARSPATRIWGESNCGGFWGPELRMTGYDGLWLTGRALQPEYLWINQGHVEIRSAEKFWGMETYQTQTAIAEELNVGRVRVAVIGPSGEALLPLSVILTDHGRVAGRTGLGAVMGSKNLKAIAVKGNKSIPVASPESYSQLRTEANRGLRVEPQSQVVRQLGSACIADYLDYLGVMPKRYYQSDLFDGATRISGSSVTESILTGVSACHACVIACGRVVKIEENGEPRKGPEYETLVGFGPNLWLDDAVFATRMGELCDRYGIDTISLSNAIGLAFRLFEMGKLNLKETGGVKLEWGNSDAVEYLVRQTRTREGIGLFLGQGARVLGRQFGAEEEAVQVNGLEVAYHDPRGGSGMALSYATSPRGACHNQSDYFVVEIGQVETSLGMSVQPRQAGAEKALNVALHQDWRSLFNSLVICYFANLPPQTLVHLVNSACGRPYRLEDLMRVGERAWNLKRAINIRLGLRRQNDRLPKALLSPLVTGGGTGGFVPPIDEMLDAYYDARGWDRNSGIPHREKLVELGLTEVADDIDIILREQRAMPGSLQ